MARIQRKINNKRLTIKTIKGIRTRITRKIKTRRTIKT